MYAIPALVGGLALKYAELPPVPLDTSPAAEAAREAKATTIQKKVLSDATRFTYGDAHMEDPLKALKLAPRGMGPPNLVSLGEEVASTGGYALKMRFASPNTPYRVWKDRAPRYSRFFGPSVRAELKLVRRARLIARSGVRCLRGQRVRRLCRLASAAWNAARRFRSRLQVNVEKKLVELSLITVEEGEDDTPLEIMKDGTRQPVQTAAADEAAKEAASK